MSRIGNPFINRLLQRGGSAAPAPIIPPTTQETTAAHDELCDYQPKRIKSPGVNKKLVKAAGTVLLGFQEIDDDDKKEERASELANSILAWTGVKKTKPAVYDNFLSHPDKFAEIIGAVEQTEHSTTRNDFIADVVKTVGADSDELDRLQMAMLRRELAESTAADAVKSSSPAAKLVGQRYRHSPEVGNCMKSVVDACADTLDQLPAGAPTAQTLAQGTQVVMQSMETAEIPSIVKNTCKELFQNYEHHFPNATDQQKLAAVNEVLMKRLIIPGVFMDGNGKFSRSKQRVELALLLQELASGVAPGAGNSQHFAQVSQQLDGGDDELSLQEKVQEFVAKALDKEVDELFGQGNAGAVPPVARPRPARPARPQRVPQAQRPARPPLPARPQRAPQAQRPQRPARPPRRQQAQDPMQNVSPFIRKAIDKALQNDNQAKLTDLLTRYFEESPAVVKEVFQAMEPMRQCAAGQLDAVSEDQLAAIQQSMQKLNSDSGKATMFSYRRVLERKM